MENLNSSDKYNQTDLEQSKLKKNQTENADEKVKMHRNLSSLKGLKLVPAKKQTWNKRGT